MQFHGMQDKPKWSQMEFRTFRCMLLATAYQQTITQLQLFQRGQRLNAAHYLSINPRSRVNSTDKHHTKMPNSKTIGNNTTTKTRTTPTRNTRKTKATATAAATTTTTTTTITIEQHVHEQKNKYECIPSENVLNTIKLEQELDALKKIYRVAIATLINTDQSADNTTEYNNNNILQLQAAIAERKVYHNEDEEYQQRIMAGQATLCALKSQLDAAEEQFITKVHEKNEQIATLKHNLSHVKRVNELEYNLVERWEDTRLVQATIVGENDERALLREILDYKRRLAGEERIICEIESFRNREFINLRQRILEWQLKFKNEIKQMNSKLQEQEKQLIELTKRHERHLEIYAQRVKYVEEYLEKKAEEERIIQQQLHRVECAIQIQAWWRGTMVRRGLGPYKKKSKKGKKGKAK